MRYYYLAGAIGLGAAGGAFGNNLIIRKKALDLAGGYDAVPPSPTEDAALVSRIRGQGKYQVRAVSLPGAAVETVPEYSWKDFISQTLRWNNGGLFSPDPVTRFNYNLLMLVISGGIIAIPLLPLFPGLWPLPLAVYISMTENTISAFSLFRSKLPGGRFSGIAYFLAFLFSPVYFTLMTLMGYCRVKTKWKEKPVI
jgi:cellulose synthase/poly-beta-1,6-N-acetylglucosamine synthase-like glycosyltransferase